MEGERDTHLLLGDVEGELLAGGEAGAADAEDDGDVALRGEVGARPRLEAAHGERLVGQGQLHVARQAVEHARLRQPRGQRHGVVGLRAAQGET